jgi:nucleoside-diphosphate-sugar epimerase
MKSSPIKILVTGGAGFIGSNLCEELIRLGNQIIRESGDKKRIQVAHKINCGLD